MTRRWIIGDSGRHLLRDGKPVAVIYADLEDGVEVARRIVAALNAVEGVSTEAVEMLPDDAAGAADAFSGRRSS